MAEEIKDPKPVESTENLEAKPKTAEELQAELKIANEKNEVLTKEKETSSQGEKHWKEVAGRQSGELGELRKKPEPPEDDIKDNDPEVVAEAKILMEKDKMDSDTALYNARLLVQSNRRMANRRMGAETEELIREDWQDGKMDKKLFDENQDAIYAEVDKRKLSRVSARANRNVVRDCYDTVLKKKAEELRKTNEAEGEKKRTDAIDAGSQAPGGGAQVTDSEADKEREKIKDAGTKRDSVFF